MLLQIAGKDPVSTGCPKKRDPILIAITPLQSIRNCYGHLNKNPPFLDTVYV